MREPTSESDTTAFHPVYLRMMLALAVRMGLDAKAPSDASQPTSLAGAQMLIASLLRHSQDARLGLRFGREVQLHAHGEVGLAALTAATWQDAFATLARFGAQRAPILEFDMDTDVAAASLCIRARQPLGIIHDFVFDAFAAIVDQLGAALLGAPASALVHHLPYAMPFATEAYRMHLAGNVRFDSSDGYRVSWPSAFARRACLTADAEAHVRAVAECLRAHDRSAHGEVSARVRHLLAANNGSWPTAEQVAAQLHLSPRSLFRHLAAEGSSFQTLCDAARIERARFLLIETDLPVSTIAERLGYADTSNFARSFRRLSATTPIAFRRMHRGRG